MPAAEEVRRPITEPDGDEDAVYEYRRDVEAPRTTAAQREVMRTITRDVLRQNAGRDLSPVFAEPAPAPATTVTLGGIAIDEYLACLGYVAPTGRMAPTLRDDEAAAARTMDEALRAAARRAA